jgi:hypothetical protein
MKGDDPKGMGGFYVECTEKSLNIWRKKISRGARHRLSEDNARGSKAVRQYYESRMYV